MKRLLTIALALISFTVAAQTTGIKVGTPFIKNAPTDNTITGYADLLAGGYHIGPNYHSRDSLSTVYSSALKIGMLFYETSVDSTYRWSGSAWTPVSSSSVNLFNSDGTLTGLTGGRRTLHLAAGELDISSVHTIHSESNSGGIGLGFLTDTNYTDYVDATNFRYQLNLNGTTTTSGATTGLFITKTSFSGGDFNTGIQLNPYALQVWDDISSNGFIYSKHMNYAGPQQIPDVQEVDSLITDALSGVGGSSGINGLTGTSTIGLGGTLGSNTTVHTGTHSLVFGEPSIANPFYIGVGPHSSGMTALSIAGDGSQVVADTNKIVLTWGGHNPTVGFGNRTLQIDSNGMQILDDYKSVGLENNADYKSSYATHPLALAQVNYVDAQILAKVPSQTGNSGKFLTTNGSATSWATISSGPSAGYGLSGTTTFVVDSAGAIVAKPRYNADYTNLSGRITTNTSNIASNTTAIAGKQAALSGTGFVKISGTTISYDNSTYLTANQSISFAPTGDVTGSTTGTTSLAPALIIGAGKVTNSMLAGSISNANLLNSTISGVSLGNNLFTLTFGSHLTSGASSYNGSAGATITSDATSSATASTIASRDANGNLYANAFHPNFATTVSSATPIVLTVGSPQVQEITGSTAQTITLPVASTLTTGWTIIITSSSSAAITIRSSGGNTVATLQNGNTATIWCVLASGTGLASWDRTVGVGSLSGTSGGGVLSTGATMNTLTLTGTTTASTIAGTLFTGVLQTNASGSNVSNFYSPISTGYAAQTTSTILFGGATTVQGRNILGNGNTALSLTGGNSYSNVIVGQAATITVPTATTSTWINQLSITPLPTITKTGTAVVTNTATFFIGAASTSGANNYTAYFDTGLVKVVGDLKAGSLGAIAVAFAGLPASPTEGTMVPVTDSTTGTFGATITGGGSNHVNAYWNGTNWTVH